MIAAGDPQEFVPYGREHCKLHPGPHYPPASSLATLRPDLGLQLLNALKDVSLKDRNEIGAEKWVLRESPNSSKVSSDEELYSYGQTVVWSTGNSLTNRNVYKSFTVDQPVQQALWCNFVMADNKPGIFMSNFEQTREGKAHPSICILDANKLNIFTTKGEEFIVSLPFQVAQVWPVKCGLLLERVVTCHEMNSPPQQEQEPLSTLFSLLHPLDEITPVIRVGASMLRVGFFNDQHMQLIFTNDSPSLVLFYNNVHGVHSVWKLRQAKVEEIQGMIALREHPSCDVQNSVGPLHINAPSRSTTASLSRFTLSSHSPSQLSCSPFRSHGSKVNSPSQHSRPHSPSLTSITHMAALSRSQSPSASGTGCNVYRYAYSPSPTRSPAGIAKTAVCGSAHVSFAGDSTSGLIDPLDPDLCLELVWTESSAALRGAEDGKASHAFLTSDFVGQTYLCYVIPGLRQVRCVKFEESNDFSQMIFRVVTIIPAYDAAPLDKCDMMLVVDMNHMLILYSGITKVCRVHVPSFPSSFASSGHLYSRSKSSRRESLVTSSRPPSAMDARFDEDVNLLSPVQSEGNEALHLEGSYLDDPSVSASLNITKLKDPVHNRITLEYSNGSIFRITIPKIVESSLVDTCLQATRHVLPRELSLQLYTKWYSTVNALGSGKGNRTQEWSTFAACLLGMMGYDLERLPVTKQLDIDMLLSPMVVAKKFKTGDGGSNDDWQFLLSSNYHAQGGMQMESILGLPNVLSDAEVPSTLGSISTTAALFPHIPAILYALHLVYEELKLNVPVWKDLDLMAPLLIQLARDLRVEAFLDHYWRDFPHLFLEEATSQVDEGALKGMQYPPFLTAEPPAIFQWIYNCLKFKTCTSFPYIHQVSNNTKFIIMLYSAMAFQENWQTFPPEKFLRKLTATGNNPGPRTLFHNSSINNSFQNVSVSNVNEMVVRAMTLLGLKLNDLECLPIGVALPLRNAIFQCRRNPPSSWPEEAYCLMGRQDLSAQLKAAQSDKPSVPKSKKVWSVGNGKKPIIAKDEDDGMENLDHEVLKLRFSTDQRIQEVRRLLQSSKPVRIALVQRPEVTDHDFIEEQERYLYAICMRTMALPVGRGMFTLRTSQPVVTETLPLPKLCLTGRAPPRNTTVDLSHIEPPANMNVWPLFHNGVAAGLRIVPNASQIDSTWIVYNKPKGSNDVPMEHAGFLMALGLNGHLNNLATMNIHDYLCKGHELTSVGLLLGIAAAQRGTMDVATTKLLSIHVEALLPPTSTELDVPHVVQVAAILGVGLVYEGTSHRHISEVLLSEIGRPPGPEMENSSDRESYSLAAGLALGLVTFGSGNEVSGDLALAMADQLYHFMVGGHKRPLTGVHKEKYKSPSYQIKEGDAVNIDVTSPGATLALGMMYFKTGNKAVAEWMTAPDTPFLLDFVRPDFLLLRTFSKGLILWDDIHPSSKWVLSHIPSLIATHAFKKSKDNDGIDYETMNQAYCNILAGACMAVGFRFAGSANAAAYDTLMEYVKLFINVFGKQVAEQAGRSTIETCLNVVLLSLAMVMAGTGHLEVLRICRYLHFRIGQANNYVLYGSHLATHMALGLLFLGGGRFTLGTNSSAVAAMICAFFPKFPIHSSDNRYHLQAFRHLYVLAVEPRLIIPHDIDTGKACYANLHIKYKDTDWYKDAEYKIKAPCILPELDHLKEISIDDSRYWPIHFDKDKNWNSLKRLLANDGILYMKQKAGCLSYVDDPQGFRSLLSQSLSKDNTGNWSVKPDAIESFSADASILNFSKYFLQESKCTKEGELKQLLCSVLYDCVTQEKTEILTSCMTVIQALQQLTLTSSVNGLWQLKLVLTFIDSLLVKSEYTPQVSEYVLNPEFTLAMQSRLEKRLQNWQRDYGHILVSYLCHQKLPQKDLKMLVAFLVYYNIPPARKVFPLFTEGSCNLAGLCLQLKDFNLSTSTIMRLLVAKESKEGSSTT